MSSEDYNSAPVFESQEQAVTYLNSRITYIDRPCCYMAVKGSEVRLFSRTQAEDKYANHRYKTEKGTRPAFSAWHSHPTRSFVDDVGFRPDRPPLLAFTEGGQRIFNTWAGPSIYEDPKVYSWLKAYKYTDDKLKNTPLSDLFPKTTLLYDYIREVFCSREDTDVEGYLLDYLAHIVQRPAELPGSALMFLGAPGTGKSFFGLSLMRPLVGAESFVQLPSSGLTGKWNAQFANRLVAVVDDPHFPRESDEAMSSLKSLITEESFSYEEKYKPTFRANNYLRVLINLNDNVSMRLDPNDRRFTVVRVSNEWRQDHKRFSELSRFLFGDCGRSLPQKPTDSAFWLFYHWLRARTITHEIASPLRTEAGDAYTEQGGNTVYTWLKHCHESHTIDDGTETPHYWFPGEGFREHKQQVYEMYCGWCDKNSEKGKVSQRRFFNEIRSWADVRETRGETNGKSVRILVFPPQDKVSL